MFLFVSKSWIAINLF
uniref:Uncharacterized protein n=1 Tax=Anguilla anguilla TaxID=7936 RepID=A0A0E9V401_ANGAN